MTFQGSTVLALDVGAARIGVALASITARIPRPLTAITNDDTMLASLQNLLQEHDVALLVVGLPRGLEGQHTAQTRAVETFVAQLRQHISLPVHWQDEALTSQKAEAELQQRKVPYSKGDIDALAATYILEDFLGEHPEVRA